MQPSKTDEVQVEKIENKFTLNTLLGAYSL